jgi:hypothetical protein
MTDTPGDPLRAMGELVANSRTMVLGSESAHGGVEVLAVFDHDFCQHLLVQEWDARAAHPSWVYRLWYRDGDLVIPVQGYPDATWPTPPLVEAARFAADWRHLHRQAHTQPS